MTNEFRFVWLGKKAGWLFVMLSLVLSAVPASFLYATSASGASIGFISTEKTTYNTDEQIILTALRGSTLPQTGGVTVVLTSTNGGQFSGGSTGGSGSCTGSFETGPANANITGNNGQKGFCYRNATPGVDTITAVFTQGSSTETATLRLEIVAVENPPVFDPESVINICQATDDSSAPFLPETVSKALILSNDSSINDSDIIPAFGDFPGQNWDTTGQAIYNNECDPIVIDPEPVELCKVTIVSNDKNTVVEKANAYAKLVSNIHPRWTAIVNAPSAWIWGDDPIADPVNETNYTFEKKFGWNGPITNATLTIAADNGYISKVNNVMAGFDSTEFNYQNSGVDVHDVTSLINHGNNILSVAVKNWAMAGGTVSNNPGGLKYELVVTGTAKDCDIPYEEEPTTATVSMCKFDDKENPLPNWTLLLRKTNDEQVSRLVQPEPIADYSGITGENGCVTFTDVPYGVYTKDEIQKDGWENVSGLGEVTVSNDLNRQIIVNRPIVIIDPEDPVATVIAHKIVCTNEAELPNWGKGGPNMTASTAVDWVNTHQSCSFASNAEFEWAPQSATNPDTGLPTTAFYGVAGGVWTKFGPTNASGTATTYLDATDLGSMSHVWMREVLKNEFIPFTYGPNNATNTNAVSAEMYCHIDVLNYDNYDRVDGISVDNTYHCVAWNHAKEVEEPEDPVLTCESEVELITNGNFENEIVTDSSLWERFATVLGWNIARVSNGASTTLELHRGWSGNVAASGLQYAELDGDHSTLISQTIATIPGETYTLGWDFAPRQLTAADQNQLTVMINDSLVLQTDPTASVGTLAIADWIPGTYSFVATGSSTKISFKNEGPSDSFGTFVDDISLRCTGDDEGDGDDDDDNEDGDDNGDGDDNATTTPPVVEPEDEDGGGSSSSGTRVGYRGGRVAGASTTAPVAPVPLGKGGDYPQIGAVLGDQINAMPYGAPNAGRGGAAGSTLPFWTLALGLCFLALVRQYRIG